ncbi:MAG: glucoamylase family protein [Pirellulales bacterium]
MKRLHRVVSHQIAAAICVCVLTCSTHFAQADEPIAASNDSLASWAHTFSAADETLLNEIQKGCFQYFWKEVGSPALLAKDKTSDVVCSTAAVGFQLSSLPIGVERGWVTREAAAARAKTVLKSLLEREDNKKFGIYLHFINADTGGLPDFSKTKYHYELTASTVDHALLEAGAMTAASYFGGDVAKDVNKLIDDADWRAVYDVKSGYLSMGWRAKTDEGPLGPGEIHPGRWDWASDEERIIYFLAAGAPDARKAIEPAAYYRLKRIVKRHKELPPYVVSWNGSLFTYFFSHCWIDYRHLAADDPAAFGQAGPGVDWFENSRRATLTQRERCLEVAKEFPTFGENRWGVAPCAFKNDYLVAEVRPNVSDRDDWRGGIVPPYAAGSAIMFTPRESMAALREYKSLVDGAGKPVVWRDPEQGGYAFADSFSLDPPHGHDENFGIDTGPLLLAIENARTGLVWKLFMQHEVAKRAVDRLKLKPR